MIEAASRWFDNWAEIGRGDSMAEGHWPMVSQIVQKMALTPGLHCVDVGCGNGYAVRAMAKAVTPSGAVLGVDVAPKMIEDAQNHPDNPDKVDYKVAVATELPVATDSQDRILSVESLYYMPDPMAALKEWHRALRSGGSLWIMVDFYKENPYSHSWPDLMDMPLKLYSEKEYRQLLEKAGFTAVVSERLHNREPLTSDYVAKFQPGWGYRGIQDVTTFRSDIGSLLVCGKKSSLDIPFD
jgi:ubiquinone/menaquinone biosynthesis C-methylase UbiE